MKPLALFRIHAKPDRPEYYLVRIFKTQQDMLTWSEEHHFNDGGREVASRRIKDDTGAYVTHAQFYRLNKDGTEKILPKIGVICFHLGEMGAGVVSHEMTHAALYWFRYHIGRYSQLEKLELHEMLCWVQGWLVKQFWTRYYRLVSQGRLPG